MPVADCIWQPERRTANKLFSLTFNLFVLDCRYGVKTRSRMMASETELMLRGYGLTTAEFFYRMPDYRNVLNSFVWQEYDRAPDYERLFGFIEYWQKEIEGPLHSVRFVHRKLIAPGEWRNVVGEFKYH